MKNFLTLGLILLSVFIYSNINAQSFYIRLDGGYNFAINGQSGLLTNSSYKNRIFPGNSQNNTYYSEVNTVYTSLGKGMSFGGALGYMFNDRLGVDLGVSYLVGAKNKGVLDGETYTEDWNGQSRTIFLTKTHTMYSKMLMLIPSLIFQFAPDKSIRPFGRVGMIMGFGHYFLNEDIKFQYINQNGSSEDVNTKYEKFEGGISWGISFIGGIEYMFTEKLGAICSVNYTGMNYSPEKSNLTEMTYNGNDQLEGIDPYDKSTLYLDSYNRETETPNREEPKKTMKITTPFSSIGIHLGVKYSFNL